MSNRLDRTYTDQTVSAVSAFDIAPDDTADFTEVPRSLYVGGTGDVAVVFEDNSEVILKNVQAGAFYPVRLKAVRATGTTATDLVGLV